MTPEAIADLLQPYLAGAPKPTAGWSHLHTQLATYLELLLKWNARTNLTAIRSPEEIVRRHFGESLFAAQHLGPCTTLLDFGSGAGFPGIPIQLLRPEIHITLAESQGKKASFLREAVRTLNFPTEVLPCRVETLPPSRTFEVTTLRAVDNMEAALQEAATRTTHRLVILTTAKNPASQLLSNSFETLDRLPIPLSTEAILEILQRRP
jgi:16S rRNA (guanine527-N7)-methyltransferase